MMYESDVHVLHINYIVDGEIVFYIHSFILVVLFLLSSVLIYRVTLMNLSIHIVTYSAFQC